MQDGVIKTLGVIVVNIADDYELCVNNVRLRH